MKFKSLKTQFILLVIVGFSLLLITIFVVYPAYCTPYRAYERVGSLFCRDLKITDIALAFFTYCLVIVGWFQIRSNESAIQELERAHVFCGPISPMATPDGTLMQFIVSNYGRTTAIIKEFCYEFSENEPSGNISSYPGGLSVKTDAAIKPGADEPLGVSPQVLSPFSGIHYCFGYIKYEDIFRKTHINRFCNKITPNVSAVVSGPPAWSSYD